MLGQRPGLSSGFGLGEGSRRWRESGSNRIRWPAPKTPALAGLRGSHQMSSRTCPGMRRRGRTFSPRWERRGRPSCEARCCHASSAHGRAVRCHRALSPVCPVCRASGSCCLAAMAPHRSVGCRVALACFESPALSPHTPPVGVDGISYRISCPATCTVLTIYMPMRRTSAGPDWTPPVGVDGPARWFTAVLAVSCLLAHSEEC